MTTPPESADPATAAGIEPDPVTAAAGIEAGPATAAGIEADPATATDVEAAGIEAAPVLGAGLASGEVRTGLAALQPFRHRNFALLWSGGLVSIIGSWMQSVAVGALVVAHTGKALWAVVVAAGAFLPIGVLSPIGGALADRVARRAALVTGNVLAGAVALVIALLVARHDDSPGLLSLLVLAQGCVSALISPFQQAILPDLVPRRDFLAAVSLNSAQFNLGRVVGPALAGIAVAAFGYPVAFLANAVSFLAVVAALAFVRLSPPSAKPDGSVWASLRVGFAAARAEPACRAAIVLIGTVAFLASPFIALVPAMARHVSHGGARGVATATGVLTTAQGVGAVLGALVIPPLAQRYGRGRVLLASLALLPPVLVAYGFSSVIAVATGTLLVVGFVYIGVLSGLSTVVQLRAPSAFRGRILALYLMALGVAYPLGSLAEGPLADRVGLGWTTAGGAVLLAMALIGIAVARPGLFRAVTAEPVAPGTAGQAASPA